jgi:hypothetical protein
MTAVHYRPRVAGMAFVLGIVLNAIGFALRTPEPSTT